MAYAVQNEFPSTFVISPGFPFHSSIWDVSPLFQGIRVRLLEDAIHDSGSANCFSLTEAKNSSNVRCSSISVKQHQTLSHRTGEVNLHPHPPPDLGHQGLFGAVWVFSFLCQKTNPYRLSTAIYHHVKPTQKLSGMRRSLVWVRYWWLSIPQQQTHSETEPLSSLQPSQFFTEETPLPWPQGHGEPFSQLEADLQIGNQIAPSSERLGLAWTHRQISDRFSTARWFTPNCRVGMLLSPW